MTGQNNGVTIDTPEGIAHFQMANAIARLRFETKTGMKSSRGSTLQFVRQQYGIVAGTKAKALRLMEEKYEATYGMKYGAKDEAKAQSEAEDKRLFMDLQGGRIVCRRHLGGYGRIEVNAHPNGTGKTQDNRPTWMTPLDTWMVMEKVDRDAFGKMMGKYGPVTPPSCEDCGFDPDAEVQS